MIVPGSAPLVGMTVIVVGVGPVLVTVTIDLVRLPLVVPEFKIGLPTPTVVDPLVEVTLPVPCVPGVTTITVVGPVDPAESVKVVPTSPVRVIVVSGLLSEVGFSRTLVIMMTVHLSVVIDGLWVMVVSVIPLVVIVLVPPLPPDAPAVTDGTDAPDLEVAEPLPPLVAPRDEGEMVSTEASSVLRFSTSVLPSSSSLLGSGFPLGRTIITVPRPPDDIAGCVIVVPTGPNLVIVVVPPKPWSEMGFIMMTVPSLSPPSGAKVIVVG